VDRRTIGLVFHPTGDVSQLACTVARWAEQLGIDVLVGDEDRGRAPAGVRPVDATTLASASDALVSIGGDGTMLGALRLTVDDPRPVLGVNVGRRGFLIEVDPPDLPAALDRLAAQDFTLEPHSCLRISTGQGRIAAFNDLALVRQPGDGFVAATLAVDGQRYGFYRCDALVVATPAGSTAYSYAAGGPVLSPATEAVVVTPSSPLAGISRSIVIAPDETVCLDVLPESTRVAIEADGQLIEHLNGGGRVLVHLERQAGQVVRLDPHSHRKRSQIKLSLLDLPLLPEQMCELLPSTRRDELGRQRPPAIG
jgi:NAD+ kinase